MSPRMVFSNRSSDAAAVGQPQHVAHLRGIDHAAAMGDRLVEHGQPVAHRAVGGTRHQAPARSGETSTFSAAAIWR